MKRNSEIRSIFTKTSQRETKPKQNKTKQNENPKLNQLSKHLRKRKMQ